MGNGTKHLFENSYFPEQTHIIIAISFVLITVLSVIANIIVWVAILFNRQLRSAMNFLVLNLSLADMVTSVTIYPYIFIVRADYVVNSQREQNVICIFTEGLTPFFIAAGTSLLTLCAISFNRYLAIMYPERQNWRMSKRDAIYFNIFSWVFSTVFMIPSALSFRYVLEYGYCDRSWGNINSVVYRIAIWLVGMTLPLAFLFLSFGAILHKSRKEDVFLRETIYTGSVRSRRFRKAEKMLGMLILVYLICWLPFCIYWGLSTFSTYFSVTSEGVQLASRWLRITVVFATLNGFVNPFIYGLGSKELKAEIRIVTRKCFFSKFCNNAVEPQPFELYPTGETKIISREKARISRTSTQRTQQTTIAKLSL